MICLVFAFASGCLVSSDGGGDMGGFTLFTIFPQYCTPLPRTNERGRGGSQCRTARGNETALSRVEGGGVTLSLKSPSTYVYILQKVASVESLQSHMILTMSHWSSGLPVCFPPQGTQVQITWGYLCETGILLLALSRYIGDPDVFDHQQGFVPNCHSALVLTM